MIRNIQRYDCLCNVFFRQLLIPEQSASEFIRSCDYLTADELEQYKDMIVYATDSETGETAPCGIKLENNDWLSDYGYYTGTVCFGIAYATDNKGNAVDFFHYVMN